MVHDLFCIPNWFTIEVPTQGNLPFYSMILQIGNFELFSNQFLHHQRKILFVQYSWLWIFVFEDLNGERQSPSLICPCLSCFNGYPFQSKLKPINFVVKFAIQYKISLKILSSLSCLFSNSSSGHSLDPKCRSWTEAGRLIVRGLTKINQIFKL